MGAPLGLDHPLARRASERYQQYHGRDSQDYWHASFGRLYRLHAKGVAQKRIAKLVGVSKESIRHFYTHYLRELFNGATYRSYLEDLFEERLKYRLPVGRAMQAVAHAARAEGIRVEAVTAYERGKDVRISKKLLRLNGRVAHVHRLTAYAVREGSKAPYTHSSINHELAGGAEFGIFVVEVKGFDARFLIIPAADMRERIRPWESRITTLYIPLVRTRPRGKRPSLEFDRYERNWEPLRAEPLLQAAE